MHTQSPTICSLGIYNKMHIIRIPQSKCSIYIYICMYIHTYTHTYINIHTYITEIMICATYAIGYTNKQICMYIYL